MQHRHIWDHKHTNDAIWICHGLWTAGNAIALALGLCLEFGKWQVHVLSLFIVCWLVILIREKMQDGDKVDC
jgi:hypothetical protein